MWGVQLGPTALRSMRAAETAERRAEAERQRALEAWEAQRQADAVLAARELHPEYFAGVTVQEAMGGVPHDYVLRSAMLAADRADRAEAKAREAELAERRAARARMVFERGGGRTVAEVLAMYAMASDIEDGTS